MTRKQRRLSLIGAALGVLALAVGLVLFALEDSIVFFNSPTDVVEKHVKAGQRIRIGGLVKEGSEVMGEDFDGAVMDAALIGAAQRVEHYEIAAYGTVCEFSRILGESEHTSLLEQTLEEEKETDQKLTELAKDINSQANEGEAEEEEEQSQEQQRRVEPVTTRASRKSGKRIA